MPVFQDRQFERIFCVTKAIVEYLIQACAKNDPFFTDIHDVSGHFGIAPVAKVLMALKIAAYGCSPSAFQYNDDVLFIHCPPLSAA